MTTEAKTMFGEAFEPYVAKPDEEYMNDAQLEHFTSILNASFSQSFYKLFLLFNNVRYQQHRIYSQ